MNKRKRPSRRTTMQVRRATGPTHPREDRLGRAVDPSLSSRGMSTVLLVADATWVSNEVRAALSLGEWGIEEVSDPRTVTDLAKERRPDAVVVDMQVGSMGGMAVIRGIRGEIEPADRPRTVLLLDRSADKFLAGRAGADAFVTKPINASELREALYPVTGGTVETTETKPRRRRTRPSASDRSADEEE